MERKNYVPQFKAVDVDGSASWVMATLNEIDHDRDVALKGFFGRQTFSIVPAHQHEHVPLGKADVREVGNEAIVRAKFNLDIAAARDWHSAIKFDFDNPPAVQEYSYAYTVLPGGARTGTFKGQPVRFLQPRSDGSPGADVYETSPVLRGAGRTRTLAVKDQGLPAHVVVELDAIAVKLRAWDEGDDEQAVRAELDAIAVKLELATIVDALRDGMARDAERHFYAECEPPAPAYEHAAWGVLRTCAAELGTDLPLLRWYRPETTAEKRHAQKHGARDWVHFDTPVPARGLYARDVRTVWILADLDRKTMLSTVAHEVAHAAGGGEDEAQRYEQRWAENLPALN